MLLYTARNWADWEACSWFPGRIMAVVKLDWGYCNGFPEDIHRSCCTSFTLILRRCPLRCIPCRVLARCYSGVYSWRSVGIKGIILRILELRPHSPFIFIILQQIFIIKVASRLRIVRLHVWVFAVPLIHRIKLLICLCLWEWSLIIWEKSLKLLLFLRRHFWWLLIIASSKWEFASLLRDRCEGHVWPDCKCRLWKFLIRRCAGLWYNFLDLRLRDLHFYTCLGLIFLRKFLSFIW